MPQEVLSKLGSDEDCDDGSTVRINQHHIQRPPFLVFRRHGFPVYQPCSVSSVPAPSVSMGVYSVNLVILEGPDTETVTDISVTVTTEEMFDVRSAQSKRR